jgi:hypothetical protein
VYLLFTAGRYLLLSRQARVTATSQGLARASMLDCRRATPDRIRGVVIIRLLVALESIDDRNAIGDVP